MTSIKLVLPFLAILPLAAQTWEAGVFVGNQTFNTTSVDVPGQEVKLAPDSKIVYGVRGGASVLDLGPVLLQLTAGYQPEVTTNVLVTTRTALGTDVRETQQFKASHASVGAMFNFKTLVAVGAGLECRFENYDLNGTKASYTRPWFRGNVGLAFPSPVLKPFIGLEVAFPLASKSLDVNSSADDRAKSVAPTLQIGLYGGVRF